MKQIPQNIKAELKLSDKAVSEFMRFYLTQNCFTMSRRLNTYLLYVSCCDLRRLFIQCWDLKIIKECLEFEKMDSYSRRGSADWRNLLGGCIKPAIYQTHMFSQGLWILLIQSSTAHAEYDEQYWPPAKVSKSHIIYSYSHIAPAPHQPSMRAQSTTRDILK